MTETENELLSLILSEWVKLTLDDPAQRLGEGFYQWRRRASSIRNLDRLGVAVDATWFGRDSAGRQARRRAMAGLVADGWVTLRVVHRRLSFARPTAFAIQAILAGCEDQVANEPPEVEQTWLLEPKLLTSDEADLAATELETSIADTDDKLDAMLDELKTGSEPPQ